MQLRDYQIQIKQKIYKSWANGSQNICIQMPTGSGKTILFTDIISEFNGVSMLVAHRMELVTQMSLALARIGLRHNIIASKATVKNIIAVHMFELKKNYYDPHARCHVAGVDTLIKFNEPWFNHVQLLIQDEAHHVLQKNKWGKVAQLFPNARGLYPTATPLRADGHGLGRHADGVIDILIPGPSMRDLINDGYLSDYIIYAPPSDLDLSLVTLSATGDYSPPKLREAVHKSQITGDIISHYLRFANNKLGITFAVDIESATEIASAFRQAGVSAEVISGKTPDLLRAKIMSRFRNREILQLVNVDLLGEGVDVPAIEVVSMARPTQSYALYVQQFGRALRTLDGKNKAIIIDHVGNVFRHGLPDRIKQWSLDRRERRTNNNAGIVPIKRCLNPMCALVYERIHKNCPHCGFYSAPAQRSTPEFVDGDLIELDSEILAKLRGEIKRIDSSPHPPQHLDNIAQQAVVKRHTQRQEQQNILRQLISLWAGFYKSQDYDDSKIYRLFYFSFGVDIANAQAFGVKDATLLTDKIRVALSQLAISHQKVELKKKLTLS